MDGENKVYGLSASEIEMENWSAAYGLTDIGLKRSSNEDMLVMRDNVGGLRVFAVADGVGGRKRGEVASLDAVLGISRRIDNGRGISDQDLQEINQEIRDGATTLVLAQSRESPNTFEVISIGDSSALVINSIKRTVSEITPRDENDMGVVTQAMGPEAENSGARLRRPHHIVVRLEPGDTLLLATDGFTRYMDNGSIRSENILTTRNSFKNNKPFVEELIHMAKVQGGADNITVVSIPYRAGK